MEWISVKDKAPTSTIPVLATDGEKHEIVVFENGHWYGKTSEYGFLMILKCVSHWIPLPPLPENCNCAICDAETRQILDETYHKPIEN